MSDIHEFEPLFGSWYTDQLLGKGSYGSVYRAHRSEFGSTFYSAIKHISIEGSADYSAEQVAKSLMREIEINYQLRGDSHFVSFEDSYFVEKPDGKGYDAFVRMELLTPLLDRIKNNQLPENETIRLGIEICEALEGLERRDIIHRDIKPENIFIGPTGNYKLGDFGVARSLGGTISGVTVAGTFNYMSPEIYRSGMVNHTADIYSLGIVLYRLLNGGRAPFLPPPPATPSYEEASAAMSRRMNGEALPAPAFASPQTANVILRACAFHPAQRYQSAREFKNALQTLGMSVPAYTGDATVAAPVAGMPVYGQSAENAVFGASGSRSAQTPGSGSVQYPAGVYGSSQNRNASYNGGGSLNNSGGSVIRNGSGDSGSGGSFNNSGSSLNNSGGGPLNNSGGGSLNNSASRSGNPYSPGMQQQKQPEKKSHTGTVLGILAAVVGVIILVVVIISGGHSSGGSSSGAGSRTSPDVTYISPPPSASPSLPPEIDLEPTVGTPVLFTEDNETSLSFEAFEIEILGGEPAKNYEDKDCFRVYYRITNLTEEPLIPWLETEFVAFQNGTELETAYLGDVPEDAYEDLAVMPGFSIIATSSFELVDDSSWLQVSVGDYRSMYIEGTILTVFFEPSVDVAEDIHYTFPTDSDPKWNTGLSDEGDFEDFHCYIGDGEYASSWGGDDDLIRIYFDVTNKTDSASSFPFFASIYVIQDGIGLVGGSSGEDVASDDLWWENIEPGATLTVSRCWTYRSRSPVTVLVYDYDSRSWIGCNYNFN